MREGCSDRNRNATADSKLHVDPSMVPTLLNVFGQGQPRATQDSQNNEPVREGQPMSTDRDIGTLDTSLSLNLSYKSRQALDLNLAPPEESPPILNQG